MPRIHSLKLAAVLATVLTLVMTSDANGAVTTVETDRVSGAADAKALDLHLLGRHLTFGLASTKVEANAVNRTLDPGPLTAAA